MSSSACVECLYTHTPTDVGTFFVTFVEVDTVSLVSPAFFFFTTLVPFPPSTYGRFNYLVLFFLLIHSKPTLSVFFCCCVRYFSSVHDTPLPSPFAEFPVASVSALFTFVHDNLMCDKQPKKHCIRHTPQQGGFWYGEGGGASALEAAMGQWGGDLIHLDTGGDTEETDDDSSAHGLFIAQGNSEQAIAADDAAGDGLAGRRVTAAEGQRVGGDDAAAVSGGGVDAVGECDGRNDELESWEIVDAPLEYWEGFPVRNVNGVHVCIW